MISAGSHRFSQLLAYFLLVLISGQATATETFELKPHYRQVTLSGFTYPRKEMTLTSEVSGRCLAILADVGEIIPTSGKLVEIDTTFIQLDLQANTIALKQARRQMEQEQKELARSIALRKQQSTAQAALDEVKLSADVQRLTIDKLENEKLRLEEQLSRYTITAPAGWLVIERFTEPGEFIQAGRPIARLGDFQKLLVPVAVSYNELQALGKLQPLTVNLPEVELTVPTEISEISPVFDARSRKINIELEIDTRKLAAKLPLRGGLRAEITFILPQETGAYLIPQSALISRYETHWLERPNGERQQVILLGMEDDGKSAVVSGESLRMGQRYLLRPPKTASIR